MADQTFTLVDVVAAAVILIAGLLALNSGLVRVLLFIASWVGAALAAVFGFSRAKPYAHEFISPPWAADATAGLGLFVFSFILISLLTWPIGNRVRDSAFRGVDRSLGLAFGLLVGVFVVCAVYLGYTWIVPPAERPEWVQTAWSRPYIERGAEFLKGLVPRERGQRESAQRPNGRSTPERSADPVLRELMSPTPKAEQQSGAPGYNDRERRDMERLFDSLQ